MADLDTEYLRRVNIISSAPIPYLRKQALLGTLKSRYETAKSRSQGASAAPQFPTGEFEVGGRRGMLVPTSATSTGALRSRVVFDDELEAQRAQREAAADSRRLKARTDASRLAEELASQVSIPVLPKTVPEPGMAQPAGTEIPVGGMRPARVSDLLSGSVPNNGVMYFAPLPDGTVPQANVPFPLYRELIDQVAISRGEEGSPWTRAEREAARRGEIANLAQEIGVTNPYEIPTAFESVDIASIGRTAPERGLVIDKAGADIPLVESQVIQSPRYTPQQEAALNELRLQEADLDWQMAGLRQPRQSFPIGLGYPIPPATSDYERRAAEIRSNIQNEREAITQSAGALDTTTALSIFNEALEQTNGDRAKAAELARQIAKERGYSW
jgi:hypothetical protein